MGTDPAKVAKLSGRPLPRNIVEVRNTLGLASYRHFKDFFLASIASTLHHRTHKEQAFLWDKQCNTAFDLLQTALTRALFLAYPDPSRTIHREYRR